MKLKSIKNEIKRTVHGAKISDCGLYRYVLWRVWKREKPTVMFIMLNPSTADASKDDPTIRRCINFAVDQGYGGMCVCNLFAYRATKFKVLKSTPYNPISTIGPENDNYIFLYSRAVDTIVCAWGNHGHYLDRAKDVVEQLELLNTTPYCLGVTNSNEPKHPLYLRKDTRFMKYC